MSRDGCLGFTEQTAGTTRSVCCMLAYASQPIYVCERKKKKFTNSPCPSFLSEKKRIYTSKETGIDQCDQMKYKVYLLYMIFYSEWKMAFQINEE